MECSIVTNKEACSCSKPECERYGLCCECLRHHLKGRSLPACVRDLDWVQTRPVEDSAE